jgi:glutamyl-tRNA synthetase
MLAFLFTPDDGLAFAQDAIDVLRKDVPGTLAVLDAALQALDDLRPWTTTALEEALRAAIVEGLGIKPRVAFTPLRVAVTGRRVSPPLFESMQILGRDPSLDRLRRLREWLAA